MAKKHKVIIPFPSPKPAKDVKYKFAYEKPVYVNVVGSFALRTMVKEAVGNSVDLLIQMPSVCGRSLRLGVGRRLTLGYRACSKRRTTSIIDTSISAPITWHVLRLVLMTLRTLMLRSASIACMETSYGLCW